MSGTVPLRVRVFWNLEPEDPEVRSSELELEVAEATLEDGVIWTYVRRPEPEPGLRSRAVAAAWLGELCQSCGSGTYVSTEQGVECSECAAVAGIGGEAPPGSEVFELKALADEVRERTTGTIAKMLGIRADDLLSVCAAVVRSGWLAEKLKKARAEGARAEAALRNAQIRGRDRSGLMALDREEALEDGRALGAAEERKRWTDALAPVSNAHPADGTEIVVTTRGMPGVFPGDRAIVRHRSPAGQSNLPRLVWLECEVVWSHGAAEGFWAGRGEYVAPPGPGRGGAEAVEAGEAEK